MLSHHLLPKKSYWALLPMLTAIVFASPTDVVLNSPSTITPHSMTLTWSQNTDLDFQRYLVYKGTTESFDTTGKKIADIGTATTTTTTASGLRVTTDYYFKIFVRNQQGVISAGSNEVSAVTLPNA